MACETANCNHRATDVPGGICDRGGEGRGRSDRLALQERCAGGGLADAAAARENLAWELTAARVAPAEALPIEDHAGIGVSAYRLPGQPRSNLLHAAIVGSHMLIASGPNSKTNLVRMIDSVLQGEAGKSSVLHAPYLAQAATTLPDALRPGSSNGFAFLSLTGLLCLAGSTGTPGAGALRRVRPSGGLIASATVDPSRDSRGGILRIDIIIPAAELIAVREALFGDAPILDISVPVEDAPPQ